MSEQTDQTAAQTSAQTAAVVVPYRFTDRPEAMISFLEQLGLRTTIRRGGYAVLAGRSGAVAVHPVMTSEVGRRQTSLNLDVPDVVALVDALGRDGVEGTWWDESWGRQAQLAGPTGLVGVNAEMDDFHGYQTFDDRPPGTGDDAAGPVDVVSVVFTTDFDALTGFFGRLGFAPGVGEADGWRPLRGGPGRGTIGLHAAERDGLDSNGYLTAALSFETAEPLDRLAARLRAAGHPVKECTAGTVPPTAILAVTDPDGERIEVHPAPEVRGQNG
ncbi:catechol 2,3-dioxygenase-like lactoylglutathione lyase family enzyme [Friedmanniella endophytica]|uniref:Catechol 2,3-dioxygenase-like lactoylglutathione lyase family enzyme n=1 Tax=Microlunatus kandeliicorticis TaxID=1759536 RepID=A0A7W3IW76_9ACTN|nr:VOC family protein [Microlunatus kandeliicorticis]MBA8796270.1 catechol 2,3-dioxygenase-like lactoylglutathione lyase family enzyme [Microlunatus kandeliicorticis]